MTLRFSLRTKLTLALFGMSFVTIAVVGLTSRWVMLARFDDLVVNRAFVGFHGEVVRYYETYGSFAAADSVESFTRFVQRNLPPSMFIGPGDRPNGPGAAAGPRERRREGARVAAPPRRRFDLGGSPPSFIVVDREGTVLVTLGGERRGAVVDLRDLAPGIPITLDDQEIGLAVPLQRPELTDLEREYLAAAQDSWVYALLLAVLLAIPVGLVLANHFAAPVRDLTGAIQAMRQGKLRQTVEVRTKDELGQLSSSFNEMSEDLSLVYTELQASRGRLEKQASLLEELIRRDDLTSLLNRRAFDEQAQLLFKQASRYDRPLSLAMADVDHFKHVNDDFSHATGDAVLREIASLIDRHIRDIDLVARYGGEEFAIAFPETASEDAARLAERLRQLVADHDWDRVAPGLSVTLSVGVGEVHDAGSFQEILEAADKKLYEAKAQGRNRVCA